MGIFSIFKRRRRPELEQKGPAGAKRRQKQTPVAAGKELPPSRQLTWRSMVVLMVLLIWGATIFTTVQRTRPTVDFVENQLAPRNIYAEVDFNYVDIPSTELLRKEEAQAARHKYRFDHSSNEQMMQEVQNFLKWLDRWDREQSSATATGEARTYLTYGPDNLALFKAFLSSPERQEFFTSRLRELLRKSIVRAEDIKIKSFGDRTVMIVDENGRAQPSDIDALYTPESAAQDLMSQMVEAYGPMDDETRVNLASQIVEKLLRPNTVFDVQATEAAQTRARASVQDVLLSVGLEI